LHLADLIEMAEREGVRGPAGDYPEWRYVPDYAAGQRLRTVALVGERSSACAVSPFD